jgi:hypothetical protein
MMAATLEDPQRLTFRAGYTLQCVQPYIAARANHRATPTRLDLWLALLLSLWLRLNRRRCVVETLATALEKKRHKAAPDKYREKNSHP